MNTGVIVGGVIGGIITVVGYFLVARWQMKKKWQDKALREHVEDLIEGPINSMLSDAYTPERVYSHALDEDELLESFNAHFPEMAKKWREYIMDVVARDKEDTHLIEGIKGFISKTVRGQIQFRNFSKKINIPGMPAINEDAPGIFCNRFFSCVACGLPPTLDFGEAMIEKGGGGYKLECKGTTIAATDTKEEAEEIKRSFVELQGNQEYIGKSRKVIDINTELEKRYEELREDLFSIRERYRKYKKLERQDGCPICQEIFNLKKKC